MDDTAPILLLVDDQPENLRFLEQLLGERYMVKVARNGETALRIVERTPELALVLLDIVMPGLDGYEVCRLIKSRAASKDLPIIFVTALDEVEDERKGFSLGAVDYITKPFNPEIVKARVATHLALKESREHVQVLLKKTLTGSIKVLTEVLAMAHPRVFSRSSRRSRYVKEVAHRLNLENTWQFELAALLSQIGYVTFSGDGSQGWWGSLGEEERHRFEEQVPRIGHDLLRHIPNLHHVAVMILHQRTTERELQQVSGDASIKTGAAMLRVVLDFDELIVVGMHPSKACSSLRGNDKDYRQEVLRALEAFLDESEFHLETKELLLKDLQPHMVLDQNVWTENQVLLASQGSELNETSINQLRFWAKRAAVREPIRVRVPLIRPIR
ncbi:MAG: hypothetical protein A2284_05375 [Deltaproteobacteria bacterium RIFOXYA12_FULL_61_11]|nr:MAG: hypothetical protein A2284_05375 [Deltaproteobacteria bacterium RIFOXYA12_FULL_61_11]